MKRKIEKVFKLEGVLYALCDDNSLWYLGIETLHPRSDSPGYSEFRSHWQRVDTTDIEESE